MSPYLTVRYRASVCRSFIFLKPELFIDVAPPKKTAQIIKTINIDISLPVVQTCMIDLASSSFQRFN